MPTRNLTDAFIRGLKHADGEVIDRRSGLAVRADRTGAISFSFRYRIDGRRRRLTIGRYPAVSLYDARARAGHIREEVRNGSDPQAARKAPEALRFGALAGLYVTRYARPSKVSWRADELLLRRHVLPAWSDREAAAITRQDVAKLLFDIAARTPVQANRVRALLSKVFGWAVDNVLLENNPVLGTKRPTRESRGRTRVLNDDELRALWHAFDRATGVAGEIIAALRVLALLGQRPGEIAGMAVAELHDLDDINAARWEIPAHRMKAKRPHVVPLTPWAREIVLGEMARRPGAALVFAANDRDRVLLGRHKLARTLAEIIRDLDAGAVASLQANRPTPHDFRRSCATALARLGIAREDRLALLAHSHGDVHEAHYDHFDRLPQKRAALLTWERHLHRVVAGGATP